MPTRLTALIRDKYGDVNAVRRKLGYKEQSDKDGSSSIIETADKLKSERRYGKLLELSDRWAAEAMSDENRNKLDAIFTGAMDEMERIHNLLRFYGLLEEIEEREAYPKEGEIDEIIKREIYRDLKGVIEVIAYAKMTAPQKMPYRRLMRLAAVDRNELKRRVTALNEDEDNRNLMETFYRVNIDGRRCGKGVMDALEIKPGKRTDEGFFIVPIEERIAPPSKYKKEQAKKKIGKKLQAIRKAAGNFMDTLIVEAFAAKREDKNIIIGFETDWLTGLSSKQRAAFQGLKNEITKRLAENMAKRGLDNVIIIEGEGESLGEEVVRVAGKTATPESNVMIAVTSKTMGSALFKDLKSEKKIFLLEIDLADIIKERETLLSDEELHICFVRMLEDAVKYNFGKGPRWRIYKPRIKPIDTNLLRKSYDIEQGEIHSRA